MYYSDAHLIEKIERDGDEYQRHQIWRGNDGGYKHYNEERVFAVLGKHFGSDQAHLPKEESDDGQLEHHAHDQRQRYKGRDVRIERDIAHNP